MRGAAASAATHGDSGLPLDPTQPIFEGELLDKKGVIAITKLPTKQELMGKTAVLLKALPTKLARSLDQAGAGRIARVTKQAAGQKLVQAVKAVEGKKE